MLRRLARRVGLGKREGDAEIGLWRVLILKLLCKFTLGFVVGCIIGKVNRICPVPCQRVLRTEGVASRELSVLRRGALCRAKVRIAQWMMRRVALGRCGGRD